MKRDILGWLAGLLALFGLFSCATPPGAPGPPLYSTAEGGGSDSGASRLRVEERPGLATGWGREKRSEVSSDDFVRAGKRPADTDQIYYNDKAGIEAMAARPRRVEAIQPAAGGLVEWGVKGRGGFLTTLKERGEGRRLVQGAPGSEYILVIRNRSRSTLEIVASVDGLDVMDGKPASVSRRGYLVHPGATLEIDGFRTSYRTVAAFRFSTVASSYANLRHGDTRNVGVIGLAVFTEKGVDPWRTADAIRRDQARPFAEAPVVRGGVWGR